MKIKDIKGREILDSRGNPTVEAEIITKKGRYRASVPSGASTGEHEATELRDKDKRFHGKGVKKAVSNINKEIAKRLKGINLDQKKIDQALLELDGTENKENLGANAILAVSMAGARAGAASRKIPLWEYLSNLAGADIGLPCPCFNVLNGGEHAGNNLDIQEFMISPRLGKFYLNLRAGAEIYHYLKEILEKDFSPDSTNVGDEGGFAPSFEKAETALSYLEKAITKAGYNTKNIKIALDCAASEFYNKKKNTYQIEEKEKNKEEIFKYYKELVKNYPIFSIEDPFDENDFETWAKFKKENKELLVIGDDLLTTNPRRIREAIKKDSCNGLLLKINQIGTITESIAAMQLARSKDWKIMVSHRSGETCDNFIADLAVGLNAEFIKSGAPARGERVSKYNQLLRIEEELK